MDSEPEEEAEAAAEETGILTTAMGKGIVAEVAPVSLFFCSEGEEAASVVDGTFVDASAWEEAIDGFSFSLSCSGLLLAAVAAVPEAGLLGAFAADDLLTSSPNSVGWAGEGPMHGTSLRKNRETSDGLGEALEVECVVSLAVVVEDAMAPVVVDPETLAFRRASAAADEVAASSVVGAVADGVASDFSGSGPEEG